MKRIICIGNRYDDREIAGPNVYDRLAHRWLPPDVEVYDGGLASLDLLRYIGGAEMIVFVDALPPAEFDRDVVLLTSAQTAALAGESDPRATGLAYFMRVLLQDHEDAPPAWLVGVCNPQDKDALDEAANAAVSLAVKGAAVRLAPLPCLPLKLNASVR